jgi:hypothetical protein
VAVEEFGARHVEEILDGILHGLPAWSRRPVPLAPARPRPTAWSARAAPLALRRTRKLARRGPRRAAGIRGRSYSSRATPKSCISIWNRLMKLR